MLLARWRHLEKCPCQCSLILCCIYSPSERSTLSLHVKKKVKNILFICWFHLAKHDNCYYRLTIITSTIWMDIIVPKEAPTECLQTFSWLQFKMEEKISLQWATLLAWALHCPNRPSTTWLCRGDHLQLTWALSKPQICPALPSGVICS